MKRKQKFVRLKFGKVKLWSKAPSFYRVHPTHLPSGFGHAVVQRPHSALPNLPQRRTEVYVKYQQLKNHIIFLHTLSYIIHVFHSHELVSKKSSRKKECMKCMYPLPCFAMFGPCFLVARHDADVSLGADVPPTALGTVGRCGKRCKKYVEVQNSGEQHNNNEIQRITNAANWLVVWDTCFCCLFDRVFQFLSNTMNLGESKRKVLTCSILREFCLQPSSSLEHLSFLLPTHPSFSGHICLNNFASGFKS